MKKKQVPDILELLDYIASYDKMEGGRRLYGSLDWFLKKSLGASNFLAFSMGKDTTGLGDKDPLEYCRAHWNRSKIDEFEQSLLKELLTEICEKRGIREKWHQFEKAGKHYQAIYCGEGLSQIYFGLFYTESAVPELWMDTLLKFLMANSHRLNRMDELKQLESLVHIDDVTGLFNQRKLLKDLEDSIRRYHELKEEFTVLFIDIDHFKKVNDGHGHLVGTQLLSDMAVLLRRLLRESDLIYRYGGDEFVMIIRDITQDIARKIGDRILTEVEKTTFRVRTEDIHHDAEDNFKLTVSIGVAGFPVDANSKEEVLAIADRMMYQAKESGRGRVCYADELFEDQHKKVRKA